MVGSSAASGANQLSAAESRVLSDTVSCYQPVLQAGVCKQEHCRLLLLLRCKGPFAVSAALVVVATIGAWETGLSEV